MAKLMTTHEIISDKSQNPVVSSDFVKHGNAWLNEVIDGAATEVAKKADKTYVDAELAKKANASDVTALNNKVDSKADAGIVAQLQATVNTKADTSTVAALSERVTTNTTKTVDLQSQIDNLVIEAGGDSNPEVIQARTDASGVNHATLKDRIDSEVTDLKSDLDEYDKNYRLNVLPLVGLGDGTYNGIRFTTTDVINAFGKATNNFGYEYAAVSLTPGDYTLKF